MRNENRIFSREPLVPFHCSILNCSMCWSAEVSWTFGLLDLVFVAVLLRFKMKNTKAFAYHGTYAAFMLAIAAQEWAQYAVWRLGHLRDDSSSSRELACSSAADVAFSFAATMSAQSIPLIFLASAFWEPPEAPHPSLWREYSSLSTDESERVHLSYHAQRRRQAFL
jgi:hypothetical protein